MTLILFGLFFTISHGKIPLKSVLEMNEMKTAS